MAGQLKRHFLNDEAVRRNKSLGAAVGLKHLGVHLIEVEPGAKSTELHSHHCERLALDITDYPARGVQLSRHHGQWDVTDLDALGHPR